ncbi:hypothetical protein MKK65_09815 [Methylobacterium sp. J-001]|uniref:hypothetical protein n=1 Tax=Methylobacterium sp. J-001 TaxID=2836609 RepID=UPI001FB9697E|nr:hypothetical protein [Methylobacterium sp. J-001]MCJ2116861.1 hypothetical protein [Methylobacterium sp. J-001]
MPWHVIYNSAAAVVRIRTLTKHIAMPEFLYRFRSLSRLLDSNELENQEIYFAEPGQLNDPMEGFRDVFWRGDTIVWRNFFRHYLICLDNAYTQLAVLGEEYPIGWHVVPVFNYGDINDGIPRKEAEQEILDSFFAEPCIANLIGLLSTRKFPVRRNELAAHLRSIHMLSLMTIRRVNSGRGLETLPANAEELFLRARSAVTTSVEALRRVQEFESTHSTTADQSEEFFSLQNRLSAELDLIDTYNKDIDIENKNRNFIFFNFPSDYPLKIECLIYPEWYAACFMSECRNSSIWGTYGASHTAVCLKFKTHLTDGHTTLRLKRQYGAGTGGPIIGFVPHPFHEVVYENKHEPIDFFRSLGRFPLTVLRDRWYSDQSGSLSPCGDDVFHSQDAWRDKYWLLFYRAILRKLDHWQHENEFRLVLSGDLIDFSDAKDRITTYQFEDLEGIIFGINTPIRAKLDIFKIIERKCREESRTNFKFYQARYQALTGTIEHDELSLLRFAT